MAKKSVTKPPTAIPSSGRPRVTSYDSGYEHSLQHWIEVQQLVQAADAESTFSAAKAS